MTIPFAPAKRSTWFSEKPGKDLSFAARVSFRKEGKWGRVCVGVPASLAYSHMDTLCVGSLFSKAQLQVSSQSRFIREIFGTLFSSWLSVCFCALLSGIPLFFMLCLYGLFGCRCCCGGRHSTSLPFFSFSSSCALIIDREISE